MNVLSFVSGLLHCSELPCASNFCCHGPPPPSCITVTCNDHHDDHCGWNFCDFSGCCHGHAPCYCPGTRIETDRGEVAIEALRIGDRVATLDGGFEPIRWIGRRSYAGRFVAGRRDLLPVTIRAGALGEGLPRRDLRVSPNHALYLEGCLIPASALVNGISVVQARGDDEVDYIHVELERHAAILAEGAPAESYLDDDCRNLFHNADEYAALYPGETLRVVTPFAPRAADGFLVEAVRRRIAELAGAAAVTEDAGSLDGFVDGVVAGEVVGWARNPEHPDAPVCLDVLVDGAPVATVLANRYREDLSAAGIGSGAHAFAIRLPDPTVDPLHIEVRRSADQRALPRAIKAAA